MISVGRIVRPHGNRGQVVVVPHTDFPEERFAVGATVHMLQAERVVAKVVTAGREHDGRWIVGFDGTSSIDDAETLRGRELKIPAEALHALAPGGFYAHDLVGCSVVTVAGVVVGTVDSVDLATGIPMLTIVKPHDVLVPFTDAICRRVDIASRLIEIDPPEGLIELNRSGRDHGR